MPEAADTERLLRQLKSISLFSRCSDYELSLVARPASFVRVGSGQPIVRAGDAGSTMFMVLDGTAESVAGGVATHSFGTGDYFGELAALSPAARATDVIATTDCVLGSLDTNTIYTLVDTIPGVARKMLEGLAAGMRERLGSP